ncbi:MAG: DUF1365 family protein, partial [Alphaproteobacteria bacterium]
MPEAVMQSGSGRRIGQVDTPGLIGHRPGPARGPHGLGGGSLSTVTASGIFAGVVTHARLRPRPHRLRYRIFMLLLDLDELGGLDT